MKSTGIVRRIDDLGRIVLPKELRRMFDINPNDPCELYVDNDSIVIKPYHTTTYSKLQAIIKTLKDDIMIDYSEIDKIAGILDEAIVKLKEVEDR